MTIPFFQRAALSLTVAATLLFALVPGTALAAEGVEYLRAKVVSITQDEEIEIAGIPQHVQTLEVELLSGPRKGDRVTVDNSNEPSAFRPATVGERLVIASLTDEDGQRFYLSDHFRLGTLGLILLLFFGAVVAFGRGRGVAGIVGLAFSIAMLAFAVVPAVIHGKNPLLVTIVGSFVIAVVSMYLAHGFHRRTSVALGATLLSLTLSGVLAAAFIGAARLFGAGSEAAFYLQYGGGEPINLRGLLLSGLIIGTLGVLDDVTVTQVSVVSELAAANPTLSRAELFRRGLAVGREHIASLVNTLALAYAGASLPLFILFSYGTAQPLWVILNGEPVAEELVRAMVGSIGLIMAVPIATALAVRYNAKS